MENLVPQEKRERLDQEGDEENLDHWENQVDREVQELEEQEEVVEDQG